jgi:hypothetical protein
MTVITTAARAFGVVRRGDYPRLAWLFELGESPTLHCGTDVEVFAGGAVEGCRDAPFAEFGFADRINLFGTGVVRRGHDWLFCPPCHTLDALYLLAHQGRAYVSNSLVPLFEHAGLRPDPRVHYTRALVTLASGLDKAESVIWRSDGITLHRVLVDNFTVEDGVPRRRRKVGTASFADFAGYKRHLLAGTGRELPAFQAAAIGFRIIRKSIKLLPPLERPLGGLRDRLGRRFRAFENSRYANLLFVWAVERGMERIRAGGERQAATRGGTQDRLISR